MIVIDSVIAGNRYAIRNDRRLTHDEAVAKFLARNLARKKVCDTSLTSGLHPGGWTTRFTALAQIREKTR